MPSSTQQTKVKQTKKSKKPTTSQQTIVTNNKFSYKELAEETYDSNKIYTQMNKTKKNSKIDGKIN